MRKTVRKEKNLQRENKDASLTLNLGTSHIVIK